MKRLSKTKLLLLSAAVVFSLQPATVWGAYAKTPEQAKEYYIKYYDDYKNDELKLVDQYRKANAAIKNSTVDRLVERAFWYMEYGYIVYGGGKDSYLNYGLADCSEFVSLVYGDFGYSITDVAKAYDSVGTKVDGVYSAKTADGRYYALGGVEKLRIGDILTWAKPDKAGNRTEITHVAIYIGVYNGQPAFIGTVDQDTGRNPTAIGIINDLRFSWGENFNSARRLLPSIASFYNHQLPDHKQQPPVIPKSRVLEPTKKLLLIESRLLKQLSR
ncbi:NlpC/P60 family protein [Cohnella panacarvi]|uniref:NlpC/P60 family protein n=1 Tax=Cohnella panacarvi TaxID=400776 RepID=UPI00047BC8F6|nr:NlpC/P60 family protein [Cohnella panacarvi]